MNTETILELLKGKLSINHNKRDSYLLAIINGVLSELENETGLLLESDNPNHLLFVADYAEWRYQNRGNSAGMPRDLKYRLHNKIIHSSKG